MLVLLFFILIPNIICQREYQTIPLRFDTVLKYLKQYQHVNLADRIEEISSYGLTSDLLSTYRLQALRNQTTECERDFDIILRDTELKQTWALKTIDAWGKPLPSSILKGNVYWVGDYDECVKPYYLATNKTFLSQPIETQYCTLYVKSAAAQGAITSTSFVLGLCVPASCDHSDVILLIHKLFQKSNISEKDLVCSTDPANGQEGLTAGAIATIVILSILAFIVFVGTAIDLFHIIKRSMEDEQITAFTQINEGISDKNFMGYTSFKTPAIFSDLTQPLINPTPQQPPFLVEFSALKTLRRIFSLKQKKDNESFPFIHGMRVLSLFWVIIGHSVAFSSAYSSNPLEVVSWTHNAAMQLVSSGVFSVDTFFVLSGFLTTVLFVRHIEKEGKLSIHTMILYYVHRYIRLTPAYLIIIAISINLTPYFGSGPVYPIQNGTEAQQCREEYWWTAIAYIGNIYKSDYICLPVSWYLQNDMQFHWIAPLCLIPFVLKRKPIAFILTILFILVGIGSTAGLLIYYPTLRDGLLGGTTTPDGHTFMNTIYVTPWCRVSAYFVGVLTGFIFINTGRSFRMNKYIRIIGSVLAFLIALLCIFGNYPDNILPDGMDQTSSIIYSSLSRTFWSLTIGWIVYLCMINGGGIVNKILSWPIWAPFAKLNYATYLIHLSVIFIMAFNQRLPFYYQAQTMFSNLVVHIFSSYFLSIFVVVFIETPFFLLEKKLFKR